MGTSHEICYSTIYTVALSVHATNFNYLMGGWEVYRQWLFYQPSMEQSDWSKCCNHGTSVECHCVIRMSICSTDSTNPKFCWKLKLNAHAQNTNTVKVRQRGHSTSSIVHHVTCESGSFEARREMFGVRKSSLLQWLNTQAPWSDRLRSQCLLKKPKNLLMFCV